MSHRDKGGLNKAMIFAAGMGTRMGHLSAQRPKPMVEVAGQSIIKHILANLERGGIDHVVVNAHYKAEMLIEHLQDIEKPEIQISHEDVLLDTGGGVKKALPLLGADPFFVSNGDVLWHDAEGENALQRMRAAWDPQKMDLLLLLYPRHKLKKQNVHGKCLHMDEAGQLTLKEASVPGGYIFTGLRLFNPSLLEGTPDQAFSFLALIEKAQSNDRLYGIEHLGQWYHLSTAENVEETSRLLTSDAKLQRHSAA